MATWHVVILGHRDEENRFCRTCGPVYTSAQLAQAARVYLQETFGEAVNVTYLDAADPDVEVRYLDLLREARRAGLRFPLVLINGDVVLHGSAEPYAIARHLRARMETDNASEASPASTP